MSRLIATKWVHSAIPSHLAIAGCTLDDLPQELWPCCVDERAAFMAPFEMDAIKRHALVERDATHYGHFRPTPHRYPAFSASVGQGNSGSVQQRKGTPSQRVP